MHHFNPLDYPLCLTYPLRLAPSQWTEHVPFALFLVEALRPRSVVELGTHYGVSYCAFCQAIKALGLEARAYAVDTWQGDTHSGFYEADVLADLRRHHDPLYSSFSRLLQATFDEAAGHFADRSIDLLHIDGFHTYDAVRHDFTNWLPKLSDRAVVLLHDVNVREKDFGVWAFWEEIKARHPSFAFEHQHGLGVFTVGAALPPALQPFTEPSPGALALREFFCGLGQRISSRWERETILRDLSAQLRVKEEEIKEVWETRHRENQDLWARIGEKDQAIKGLKTQVAEIDAALHGLVQQLGARNREAQNAARQLAAKDQTIKGLTDMWQAKDQEVRDLTDRLAAQEQEIQGLQARLAAPPRSGLRSMVRRALRPLSAAARGTRKAWRLWREEGTARLLLKIRRQLPLLGGPATAAAVVGDLRVTLDRPPGAWGVGKGNVLYLTGSCYHPDSPIRRLEVVAGGSVTPMRVWRMNRPDVFKAAYPEKDAHGLSMYSGFCALVPIPARPPRSHVHLTLQARLKNGAVCKRSLGDVALSAEDTPSGAGVPGGGRPPRIAICMTTYNPAVELFTRQIESIREQTNKDWVCVISDDCSRPRIFEQIVRLVGSDPRFYLHRNAKRLGFYRNFEHCLSLAPAGVEFVALADHDDYWQPEKLNVVLGEFDDDTTLVYSDMNVVDRAGRRISTTYWTKRRNNYRNLASQFLTNTVTGAASMFRRSLLDYLLPFPDELGASFHDHWIGCTALTVGRIGYVNRPLYDYVQHDGNVIAHAIKPRSVGLRLAARLVKSLAPFGVRGRLLEARARAKAIYMGDVLRIQQMAQVLQMRCAGLPAAKSRTLSRLARLDSSPWTALWLLGRSATGWFRSRTVTMGAETALLRGITWRWSMKVIGRLRSWGRDRSALARRLHAPATVSPALVSRRAREILRTGLERVEAIEQKIAPLKAQVAADAPRRVNLLIPTIDFQYVFGGYITKFNLARLLAETGHRVRLIMVDACNVQPALWRQQLQAYPGLEDLLDRVEIVYAYNRTQPVEFHPDDALIATTWWTAHIAHHVTRILNRSRFVYLIQEYEPFTFPMGTYAALANQSYTFPHYGVFSTEFLRDYFRRNRLGVFAADPAAGDRDSVAFANTITAVGRVTVADIAGRSPRKLLFYARPEPHAARNMFEMGVAALMRAVRAGCFAKGWELYGIGTVETAGKIALGRGVTMRLLPRQGQETYREVLREHDLGLALMYTPHPSLVPIEMASAGMLAVTNTCGNKVEPLLREISPNLIAVAPTIEAVQQGLKYALDHIGEYEARVKGAEVKWSTSWDDSFHPELMARFEEFLENKGSAGTPGGAVLPPQAA